MLGLLIGLLVGLLLGFLIGNFVSSLACPHMPLLTFLGLIGLIVGQFVGCLGFFVVLFMDPLLDSLGFLLVE